MRFLSRFLITARPTPQKIEFLCNQLKLTPEQVEMCIECDPSPNQTDFIQWLARMLSKGQIRLPEDTEQIREQLELFNKLKKAPGFQGNKDINSYTPGTLFEAIENNRGNFSKKEQNRDKIREGAKVIAKEGDLLIYKVWKAPALMELSAGTNWCTAHESNASGYLADGPSYVVFDEGSAFAQFHPASNQLMDRTDVSFMDAVVSGGRRGWGRARQTKTLCRFLYDPTVKRALELIKNAGEPGIDEWIATNSDSEEKVREVLDENQSSDNSLRRAMLDKTPLSEDDVAAMFRHDPPSLKVFFRYCMQFYPKQPVPQLEKLLLENRPTLDLISYCTKFLGGQRWVAAEQKLLKDALHQSSMMRLCLEYAARILKARWPELEQKFAKASPTETSGWGAGRYALDIMKARWPQGGIAGTQLNLFGAKKQTPSPVNPTNLCNQEYIMCAGAPDTAREYALKFIQGRWPEFEKIMAERGETGKLVDYAFEVIKGRDPQIEDYLLNAKNLLNAKKIPYRGNIDRTLQTYCQNVIHGRWDEYEKRMVKEMLADSWGHGVRQGYGGDFSPSAFYGDTQELADPWGTYVQDIVKRRWPELEKAMLKRYALYPTEWNHNQKLIAGYIAIQNKFPTWLSERVQGWPWPEGLKRLGARCPGYETELVEQANLALKGLDKEGIAPRPGTPTDDGWVEYLAAGKLYKYIKALEFYQTQWPKGSELLKTLEERRAKKGGYWAGNYFTSSLLQRKPYERTWKASFLNKRAMPITPRGQQMLDFTGNKVIEEVQIGDYELFLVHDSNFNFYQIGMQRKGQDMTDIAQQASPSAATPGKFSRQVFSDTIQRWLTEYHTLIIASHNRAKTDSYIKMLKAMGYNPQDTGMFAYITDTEV